MKAVLFDLDGTLLDTLQDIANACNTALARHGFPGHPVNAYKHFVGDGVAFLIWRAVPPEHREPAALHDIATSYKEEYSRNWNATTRAYDGIPELLELLTGWGIPLAVLSNKPDDFTRRCVAEFLPQGKFHVVLGATQEFPPKPDPTAATHIAAKLGLAPEAIAYLGDTATDMKTALSAGMYPVGALWGFRDAEELRASGAKHLIKYPRELLEILCSDDRRGQLCRKKQETHDHRTDSRHL